MNDVSIDDIVRPDEQPRGGTPPPAGRDGRAERERRRKQRRIRSLIAFVIALAMLAGAAYLAVEIVRPLIAELTERDEPVATDYPGPGFGSVDVVIPEGATGAAMAEILVEADVVATARAFNQAFAADPGASSIQPGTYRLLQQMRATDAVTALQSSNNRVQTRVTIPEGFTVEQIVERLSSVTAISAEEFRTAMADPASVGLPPESGGSYEGWLHPATYTFEPNTTPTEMIARMIGQTVTILDERGVPADQRQAVLTKASLVERESPGPEQSPMMARAIENRLAQDMRLQIDASVAYGLDKPGTELTTEDLETDGPYNLYTRAGLPPTPIASPGTASIDAVLNPADGPWLFWVTINLDTGETRFAETFEEHLENQALLRAWQAENQQ